MSSIVVSSQCQCAVAVPNLHPITSPTSSSAHCASPNASVPQKEPFRSSYGSSRSSTLWSKSGASKFDNAGQFHSFTSSGSSRICRSHSGGVYRAVDGSSCTDSLETFVVKSSVQQPLQRRELVRAILSWIVLPALINAGSSAFDASAAAAAAEDDEASSESSVTPEAPLKTGLVERLLERSKANKARYDQERLDAYYRRNFKDYFEFLKGGIKDKDKDKLTEAEKGILDWLEKNQ